MKPERIMQHRELVIRKTLGFGWGRSFIIFHAGLGALGALMFLSSLLFGLLNHDLHYRLPKLAFTLFLAGSSGPIAFGFWKMRRWGLYLAYAWFTLIASMGLVTMGIGVSLWITSSWEGGIHDLLSGGVVWVIFSACWLRYFYRRRSWFAKGTFEKTKEEMR